MALVTERGHTAIIAANLATSERDVVELEKRIEVNENRERVLNEQLQLHYRDLRVAANPTARVQLERGIESILAELKVLRAATLKFLNKMRQIADGLNGIERNEFIRRHRLERRLGMPTGKVENKIAKKAQKQMKAIAKESAKKYGKIAAKQAGKKAEEEAKKKFGNDTAKIASEKKKAEKSVYKKAYLAVMKEVNTLSYGLPAKTLKDKAAAVVLQQTRKNNTAVQVDKKAQTAAVNKVVTEEMMKVMSPAEQAKLKAKNATNEVVTKKPEAVKKQLDKVKQAEKEIQKQKDKLQKAQIKEKQEKQKQKLNKGNLVPKKEPKIKNPVKETKRAIEKTVYKVEQRVKQEKGLKPMKAQVVEQRPLPDPFQGMATIPELEKEAAERQKQMTEVAKKARQQLMEPVPFEMGPAMDQAEQKQYLESLLGVVPEHPMPFMGQQYLMNPVEIDAYYNQMMM